MLAEFATSFLEKEFSYCKDKFTHRRACLVSQGMGSWPCRKYGNGKYGDMQPCSHLHGLKLYWVKNILLKLSTVSLEADPFINP